MPTVYGIYHPVQKYTRQVIPERQRSKDVSKTLTSAQRKKILQDILSNEDLSMYEKQQILRNY